MRQHSIINVGDCLFYIKIKPKMILHDTAIPCLDEPVPIEIYLRLLLVLWILTNFHTLKFNACVLAVRGVTV